MRYHSRDNRGSDRGTIDRRECSSDRNIFFPVVTRATVGSVAAIEVFFFHDKIPKIVDSDCCL